MPRKPLICIAALLATALVAGCASGKIGTAPQVQRPTEAGTLTLTRDGSLVGLGVPFHIRLDQADLYRLGRNQSYTLQLDPDEYLIEYTIGLNECSLIVNMRSRQIKRLRLTANCMIFPG